MCGRYYVDDETAREIRRLVLKLDQRFQGKSGQNMVQEAAQEMNAVSLHGQAARAAAVLSFPESRSDNGEGASSGGRADDLGLSKV